MNTLIVTWVIAATSTVLFVGNSYTMANGGQWTMVEEIYNSTSSDTLLTGNHTMGGATLQDHWNSNVLIQTIQTGNWDYCVFQEQSCMPVIDPELTYTYGDSLALLCQANGTEPTFFMTWARKNDPRMLQGLSDGYSRMGFTHSVPVSPCGVAFDLIRLNHPDIDPYVSDGAHPSAEGSYLAACVIASTVLEVDLNHPGIWVPEGILPATGSILRETAIDACSLYDQPGEALR